MARNRLADIHRAALAVAGYAAVALLPASMLVAAGSRLFRMTEGPMPLLLAAAMGAMLLLVSGLITASWTWMRMKGKPALATTRLPRYEVDRDADSRALRHCPREVVAATADMAG